MLYIASQSIPRNQGCVFMSLSPPPPGRNPSRLFGSRSKNWHELEPPRLDLQIGWHACLRWSIFPVHLLANSAARSRWHSSVQYLCDLEKVVCQIAAHMPRCLMTKNRPVLNIPVWSTLLVLLSADDTTGSLTHIGHASSHASE